MYENWLIKHWRVEMGKKRVHFIPCWNVSFNSNYFSVHVLFKLHSLYYIYWIKREASYALLVDYQFSRLSFQPLIFIKIDVKNV